MTSSALAVYPSAQAVSVVAVWYDVDVVLRRPRRRGQQLPLSVFCVNNDGVAGLIEPDKTRWRVFCRAG